jgi:hypothetical protein
MEADLTSKKLLTGCEARLTEQKADGKGSEMTKEQALTEPRKPLARYPRGEERQSAIKTFTFCIALPIEAWITGVLKTKRFLLIRNPNESR